MRRRVVSALSTLSLAGGLMLAVAGPAAAAPVTTTLGGVTYTADNAAVATGATVTTVADSAPKALVIPATVTIGGTAYAVTSIGESAADSLALTSVSLPAGLRLIDDNAFAGNALSAAILPRTVTVIDTAAFAFNSITDVTIPASVTAIGAGAFSVNPLATVSFVGAPPTTFTPTGPRTVGSLGDDADNGPDSGNAPTVRYAGQFAAPGFANGFTSPLWQGYRSVGTFVPPVTPPGPPVVTPPVVTPPVTPATKAQLVIKKVKAMNRGRVVRIQVVVKNQGTINARKVKIRIRNRPAGIGFNVRQARIGSLRPGGRTVVILTVRPTNRPVNLTVVAKAANAPKVRRAVRVRAR